MLAFERIMYKEIDQFDVMYVQVYLGCNNICMYCFWYITQMGDNHYNCDQESSPLLHVCQYYLFEAAIIN